MAVADALIRMSNILGHRYREPALRSELDSLFTGLDYQTDLEYQTGEGPADIYLPARRVFVETKGYGLAGPAKPGSRDGETQEQQCERYVRAEARRESQQLDLDGTTNVPWQCFLTDGFLWWVWKWGINPDGSLTEKIFAEKKVFTSGQEQECLNWLRARTAKNTGKPWIPSDPGAVFESYLRDLKQIYRRLKDDLGTTTKYQLWLKALEGSGCAPDDAAEAEDLFLSHTLLITISRAVVAALSPSKQHQPPEDVMQEGFAAWPQARNEFEPTNQAGVEWTKRLFETAAAYDWRRRARDVLRTLYQSLIPQQQRKAFGEYYTPDWLAQMLAERIIDDAWIENAIDKYMFNNESPQGVGVLDPTCGSGTFLFHAARRILESTPLQKQNVTDTQRADFVVKLVNGIDIHPIAVEISRATLLRALPAEPSRGADSLQVFQGDALIYNREGLAISNQPGLPFYTLTSPKGTEIRIPVSFTQTSNFGQNIARLVEAAKTDGDIPAGVTLGLNEADSETLTSAFHSIKDICHNEGDSVWAWYIFNMVSPATLSRRKVDRILANPPWVRMSEIQVESRKKEIEALSRQLGIYGQGKSNTGFDIGGLFVSRCRQNFLIEDGVNKAAWVLNWASMRGSNWEKTRQQERTYTFEHLDLGNVRDAPFSGAKSCVWIQQQDVRGGQVHRILRNKDLSSEGRIRSDEDWRIAKDKVGWEKSPERFPQEKSKYFMGKRPVFRQGATLVPYCLVKVDTCKTDDQFVSFTTVASRQSPWKSEGQQRGEVPQEWVKDAIFPDDLLPFILRSKIGQAIVPLNDQGEPDEDRDSNPYWRKAEDIYGRKKGKGIRTPETLWENLDYQGKLVRQTFSLGKNDTPRKVIYNSSGTFLRASRVAVGIISTHKFYDKVFGSQVEAAFVTAILNAPCLQEAYQQSRKSDRDFMHHFWHTVPIPNFDSFNSDHRALARLCESAEAIAERTRNDYSPDMGQIALSDRIRKALIEEGIAEKIDERVRKIIPNQSQGPYPEGTHPWLKRELDFVAGE